MVSDKIMKPQVGRSSGLTLVEAMFCGKQPKNASKLSRIEARQGCQGIDRQSVRRIEEMVSYLSFNDNLEARSLLELK